MKNFVVSIFYLLVLNGTVEAQNVHYLVYSSSPIEQFILIRGSQQDTIKSSRIDKTLFEFHCSPKETYLFLVNERCDTATLVSFCDYKSHECIEDVEVDLEEKILIANCLDTKEATLFDSLKDFLKFFQRSRNPARLNCGNQPKGFMGGDKPNPKDPKLKIDASKYAHYYDWKDFNLELQIFEDYPIQEISIISKKRQNGQRILLFAAGEANLTADIFDWKGAIPKLETILEEIPSPEKGQKRYRINGEKLAAHLFTPIELGEEYQLAVYLKNDTSGHFYLHNFQLITAAEKALIKTFIQSNE